MRNRQSHSAVNWTLVSCAVCAKHGPTFGLSFLCAKWSIYQGPLALKCSVICKMQIITVLTGEQKPDRWIEITEVQDLSKVKSWVITLIIIMLIWWWWWLWKQRTQNSFPRGWQWPCSFVKGKMKCRFYEIIAALRTIATERSPRAQHRPVTTHIHSLLSLQ